MNGLQILGTGRALPEHVVTNDDLAKIVDTSDEWIVSRTGIKERRFAREGENLTQFAVEAARQAIARAGIGRRTGAVPDGHRHLRQRHSGPVLPGPPGAVPAGGLPGL